MKRFLFSFVLFTIFLFTLSLVEGLFTIPVNAEVSCQPIYGGGQTCVSRGFILVDKKVLNPETQKMTDNLTVNDGKFVPGSIVNFQINLVNTGHASIKYIDVKDVFPQYAIFINGPGKFDANTKTLAFEVTNLLPNETRVFTVVGKVVEADKLPIDIGLICMVNQATAVTSDAGEAQDNTQFCIQKPSQDSQKPSQTWQKQVLAAQTSKGGFPVFPGPNITTSPATGPEALALIALVPTAIAGFFLRKKAITERH